MKTITATASSLIMLLTASLSLQAQNIPTNGLVCFYPLNGSAADVLGNGNTGTLYNGAFYTNGVKGQPTDAVYCNGTNAYVLCGKTMRFIPTRH
ncbi:MAG: hypothetical protein M3Y82_11220 [Verrucomicrobiota bacterium]|nr:hypothetical protein [Verrucomicrobiota bacterium]